MDAGDKLLAEAEAQEIALKFLLVRYPQAQVNFIDKWIITVDDIPIYYLHGKITIGHGSLLTHFTSYKNANAYDLKIEVDARRGKVINYELR